MQKILESRCKPAEQKRTQWQARADEGATPEGLLDPAAWANVARHMHRFDRIEVVANDESWWAEYLVWDCDRLWAKVELVQVRRRAGADDVEVPGEYELKQRGVRKWGVIRKADNEVLQDGFQTKAEAQSHLDALLARVAA